ncbi:MAG: PQQ-like beta-propeller repeat protein [Bacteroidetes bacterium]|nr:PQQ-like beta-propeller repeat protein [Bacteroidota bacterium]
MPAYCRIPELGPAFALTFLLLLAACGSGLYLDRAIEPGQYDRLQHGGDAGRTNVISHGEESLQPGAGDTLQVAWEFSLHGAADRAVPLLVDETVLFASTTGRIEVVDLHTGEQIGRFPTHWFIQSTPAVSGRSLFVATSGRDPLLLCYDLEQRRLRYQCLIPSVHAALCVVGDRVIYAARDGSVVCHSADDSLARWSVSLDDQLTAAPAANDSVVVIAGQNGDLNALAISDGNALWRISTGAAFLAGPSIRGTMLAAVNVEGVITMAETDDGTIRWRRELEVPVYQGCAWRNDTVAVALANGDVILLHATDGRELARFRTGELPGAAPQFDGAHLVLLHRKGDLMRIGLHSGEITRIAQLPVRSRTAPLITPYGIVLVDEKGEAVCVR